jgi:hypothetical protein
MLDMSEHAARDATVRLVVSREYQLAHGLCSACHRLEDLLAVAQHD